MSEPKKEKKLVCPLALEDEITQLKFEIATLNKMYQNMQEKVGGLELLIMGSQSAAEDDLM